MKLKANSLFKVKDAIAVIVTMLLLGLNTYAKEGYWNHGDQYEVKESKSANAVNIITGEDGMKIDTFRWLGSEIRSKSTSNHTERI